MAKLRIVHRCSECAATHAKWTGQCNVCQAWNTLVEDVEGPALCGVPLPIGATAVPISDVSIATTSPTATGMGELDRVLGDGVVPGSVTLLGGEPGIGKSTLLLQLLASWPGRTLYVSAEESAQQVRLRAERLGALSPDLWLLAETAMPHIVAAIDDVRPSLVVVDSIQTVAEPELGSAPGSVVQVRGCAARLVHEAKTRALPVVMVGHITKDGSLAGPRMLEHIVDVVLSFEATDITRCVFCARSRIATARPRSSGCSRWSGRVSSASRCQQAVPDGPARRCRGVRGPADARGPPATARRGAGAHDGNHHGRAAAPQRAGHRSGSAGAPARRARPPRARDHVDHRGLRIRSRGREAVRAGCGPRAVPRDRERDHREAAAGRPRRVR
jgi:hypothetical protein